MRLLFDQNLSPSLPVRVGDLYPESTHVRTMGLATASDSVIWEFAKIHGLGIVSKDSDFQQRSLLFGHPPKFIWLRVGNCPAGLIEDLLRKHWMAIHAFDSDPATSHLMLP
jgi:predicted nuclease of predicted toxin-antitoxin system